MKHQEIARKCVRGLALEADKRLLVDLHEKELQEQIVSLAESAGALLTSENPDAVIVGAKDLNGALLPAHIVRSRKHLTEGCPLVVVLAKGPTNGDEEAFQAETQLRLKLERCRLESAGERCLIFGSTKKGLTSSERKKLRTHGHNLDPVILIGRSGLTKSIVEATRTAVERHGLIKVKLTPQSTEDKDEAAVAIAWATGSHLVQRIGKTALLYRDDVPLDPPNKRVRRH